MRHRHALAALLTATALLAAGCLGDDAGSSPDGPDGQVTAGDAITVDQTVGMGDGDVVVRGFLIDSGAGARLCAAVAESFPPQCGGEALDVSDVDVATVSGATSEGDVVWVDDVIVTGTLMGRTLMASGTQLP